MGEIYDLAAKSQYPPLGHGYWSIGRSHRHLAVAFDHFKITPTRTAAGKAAGDCPPSKNSRTTDP
jgi:hypothetical protein